MLGAKRSAKSGGGSSTVKSRRTPRYGSRVVLRGGSDAAAMQSDAAARDANDAARDVNARDDRKATPPSICARSIRTTASLYPGEYEVAANTARKGKEVSTRNLRKGNHLCVALIVKLMH